MKELNAEANIDAFSTDSEDNFRKEEKKKLNKVM